MINLVLRKVKKLAELKNHIWHQLLIHKRIQYSVGYCSVTTALMIFTSHSEAVIKRFSVKKGALKKVAKVTAKHLCCKP